MDYKYVSKITGPEDIKALTPRQLVRLAGEIRHYITTVVATTGGHLASNLGVVELTIALHMAFDSPRDQFVFDVSHQSYVHKLLTGRFEDFKTLRQFGGISGFIKRSESPHDVFNAGHASTSLSAAFGLAKARDVLGLDHYVVAVIGDGALSGGLAYEGLNNIGHSDSNVIIVLNDNEMSIDKNVGGLTNYLARLRTNPSYYRAKQDVHRIIDNIPALGKPLSSSISKVKDSIKQLIVPGMLFEELGLTYIGVIDGHDIATLRDTFQRIKQVSGPVLVHIKTTKGKGQSYAERQPEKFHGVGPFDAVTGDKRGSSADKSFSAVFGESLVEIAKSDTRICAITAAMPSGTGLKEFAKQFPERFFDVGIAEGHAVTFAAGLAINGLKPYFAVYSTFLQRAYDHLIHDVCLQSLDVVFCIDRAGLVGRDGETHHGVFDISFLLAIPNMTIWVPKDGTDLRQMIKQSVDLTGPLAIRYPRGTAYSDSADYCGDIAMERIVNGDDFQLVAIGTMHHIAIDVLALLAARGLRGSLLTIKQIKPLNVDDITEHLAVDVPIFTLEDNVLVGGFGSYLSRQLQAKHDAYHVINFGIPDRFVSHGTVDELLVDLQLDPQGIASRVLHYLAD